MSWRTVVLTNRAKVEYSMGYMVIREKEVHRVFMDEIGTILVATPAAAFTGVWVSECLKRKIKIIFCDEKRNPAGEVLPYCGRLQPPDSHSNPVGSGKEGTGLESHYQGENQKPGPGTDGIWPP